VCLLQIIAYQTFITLVIGKLPTTGKNRKFMKRKPLIINTNLRKTHFSGNRKNDTAAKEMPSLKNKTVAPLKTQYEKLRPRLLAGRFAPLRETSAPHLLKLQRPDAFTCQNSHICRPLSNGTENDAPFVKYKTT
jgi:hypothetical protein